MPSQGEEKLSEIRSKLDDISETCSKIDKELALQKAAFDAHLAQDERMYEEFKKMNAILADNTESLKEHMRRTSMLEEVILNINSRLGPIEVEHIQKQAVSAYVNSMLKFIGKAAGAVTAVIGLWMLLKPYLIK
jgi:hypothetical protein